MTGPSYEMLAPALTSGSASPLVARGLTKVIGKRTIVQDVSFELHEGEVFGFLGPNGAGKTTTIRMLVGLIRPTSGQVIICGHDAATDFTRAMRCIGCIVETPDLYRFLTGRENLEHFARMLPGIASTDIERVASIVSLDHRLDEKVATYSLGMRQRLGIAQAMLGDPKVLILDEPANGLDPAGIREMRSLLRSLSRERRLSIFVSSHLLSEIEMVCDRAAIIHHGRIAASGSMHELVAANRRTLFRVDDPPRAVALLTASGADARLDDGVVSAPLDEPATAAAVETLTAAGIRIFEARTRVQTLEEIFMETTGGETVE